MNSGVNIQLNLPTAQEEVVPDYADATDEQGDTNVSVKIIEFNTTNHSDTTGKFPVSSRRGNNYVLLSVYKGYIHTEPMASPIISKHFAVHYRGCTTMDNNPLFKGWTMKQAMRWNVSFGS